MQPHGSSFFSQPLDGRRRPRRGFLSVPALFLRAAKGARCRRRYKKRSPPYNGGISFSGIALIFLLACRPCICYLLPVNGFHQSLPCVKGGGIFARK